MHLRFDTKLKNVAVGDVIGPTCLEVPNETKTEIAQFLIEKLRPHLQERDWMLHIELSASVSSVQMHFDPKVE